MTATSGHSFSFPAHRAGSTSPAVFLCFFASYALRATLSHCRMSRLKKHFSFACCKREVSNVAAFLINLFICVKQGCDVAFIKIPSWVS